MAPTLAFLSGRLGRALYIESEAWWVSDAGLNSRLARASEVQELYESPAEFERYSFSSLKELQETLQREVHFASVKFVLLRMLDSTSEIKTRLLCAEAIEPVLADSLFSENLFAWFTSVSVEQVLMSEAQRVLASLEKFPKLSSLLNLALRRRSETVVRYGVHHEGTPENPRQFYMADEGERVVPVVEEELVIGKRQVERGGVRIFSHVLNEPVSEHISLHDDHIVVERRALDRPATEADFNTNPGVIEVTETGEEAVVGKRSRVIEEVLIGKESTDRAVQIHNTARHTEVDVEEVAGETAHDGPRSSYRY